MSKINILSSKIYNRISAGEVVERPASVVKELVENSIDSGATSIEVEIVDGGITSIRVSDNGHGIENSEIKSAILPHATSKISKIEDLDNISSLGFRGEALPSIVSVSKFKMVSKTADSELGSILTTEGGENVEVNSCGALDGTEVTVNNLFYNTPAREKFLKTPRSEESEISSYMQRLILANPEISFKYVANDKLMYQSFGDGLESAFISIYGLSTLKECFFIDTEKNGIKIKGYIGKHHFVKSNRGYQSIFLNGRYVINNTVSSAISNAYSSYLMKRQYPFYVLSITVPTETVDVNVHPNKLDVRFSNNQIIYGTIYSVISKVLEGSSDAVNIIVENKNLETPNSLINNIDSIHNYVTHNNIDTPKKQGIYEYEMCFNDSGTPSLTKVEKLNNKEPEIDIFAENKAYLEKLEREKKERQEENSICQTEIKLDKNLTYVGQALNTFLLFEDGEDLYLLDQHAAHERIIFDKLKEGFIFDKLEIQSLLLPYVLEVNENESDFIIERLSFFRNLGMDIEEFGRNSFKISTIPLILSEINIQKFFDLVLIDINSLKKLDIKDLLFDKIAQKACKSAIKSGDKLSKEDTNVILEGIKNNFGLKCPHGRPIAVKISRTEIDKWFKRIV